MTGVVSTQAVLNGGNTPIPGGVRLFDVSGTGAGPWVPVSLLHDPASGQVATIKPASTAPAAADPALVVAISPNSKTTITSTARLPSSAATTNAANVKTSAGSVFQLSGKNNAAYDVFLVLYDAPATPVPGTTAIRKKMICPAGQAFVYDWEVGLSFANGIGYAFTKLVADADTTPLAAADITAFNMDYT